MNDVSSKQNRTSLWLAISAVAVAFFSLGARVAGDETARQVGQVIGAIVSTFLIAAIIWTILWLIAGRRDGRPWLSAWIGWIAMAVAFMLAVARTSDAVQSSLATMI